MGSRFEHLRALLSSPKGFTGKRQRLTSTMSAFDGSANGCLSDSNDNAIAVVVHLFYLHNLSWQVEMLSRLGPKIKIFVTTNSLLHQSQIEDAFGNLGLDVKVRTVENRGRNFAGVLKIFYDEVLLYDFIVTLHSKESPGSFFRRGDKWNRGLWEDIVGSKKKFNSILALMRTQPDLAVITSRKQGFPSKINQRLGVNAQPVNDLAAEILPVGGLGVRQRIVFPAGAMFVTRVEVVRKVAELSKETDFPQEPLASDGSSLHALERLFGIVPMISGGSLGFVSHRKRVVKLLTMRLK